VIDALAHRAPWYAVGIALGLIVVGVLWTINARLGAVGGYSDLVERVSGRSAVLGWRGWFLLGIFGGSALFVALGGTTDARPGYGWSRGRSARSSKRSPRRSSSPPAR